MARFKLFPKRERATVSDTWDLKGTRLQDFINAQDGIPVTPTSAMKFTGVLAAVSLRSNLLCSFPLNIYELKDDYRTEIPSDPLYKLLAYRPNQYMNASTFWKLMNTHLDLWGNAYAVITRYGGNAIDLTPIEPSMVEVKIENGKIVYKVSNTGNSRLDKTYSPDKILHFKDISFNGYVGISRITQARKAIELGLQAQQFGLDFFKKGGSAKGVIEMDGQMSPDAMKNFKKHWDANADQGTPLLDMGKKYHQLTIPPEDAQFLESRQFQIQDIARTFNVPPHLLMDHSRATYSNIEQANLEFLTFSLRPMVKGYEAELEMKLLGDDLGKKSIRFNMDGILRGDTASRAAYLASMKASELYSTNELRKWNGSNPSDDPKADLLQNPNTTSNNNIPQ